MPGSATTPFPSRASWATWHSNSPTSSQVNRPWRPRSPTSSLSCPPTKNSHTLAWRTPSSRASSTASASTTMATRRPAAPTPTAPSSAARPAPWCTSTRSSATSLSTRRTICSRRSPLPARTRTRKSRTWSWQRRSNLLRSGAYIAGSSRAATPVPPSTRCRTTSKARPLPSRLSPLPALVHTWLMLLALVPPRRVKMLFLVLGQALAINQQCSPSSYLVIVVSVRSRRRTATVCLCPASSDAHKTSRPDSGAFFNRYTRSCSSVVEETGRATQTVSRTAAGRRR